MYKKTCETCSIIFETNYHSSKYCSEQCKYQECFICGTFFKKPNGTRKQKTCSKKCMGVMLSAENNPNFNNKWTEEQKENQSLLIKSKFDDEYREKCGSANRGKKFSKDRIYNMHGNRKRESYTGPKGGHTDVTKKLIGIKSKEKFSEEYNQKIRKIMEEKNKWIPLSDKKDYDIYFTESNWKYRMFDFLVEDYPIINELGVFNTKTNKKGVVRDHAFSRKSGCALKVFPNILYHPENCNIITHAKNISISSKKEDDIISLEELFNKIRNTKYNWIEQKETLLSIERYENGERWSRRKEVKCESD